MRSYSVTSAVGLLLCATSPGMHSSATGSTDLNKGPRTISRTCTPSCMPLASTVWYTRSASCCLVRPVQGRQMGPSGEAQQLHASSRGCRRRGSSTAQGANHKQMAESAATHRCPCRSLWCPRTAGRGGPACNLVHVVSFQADFDAPVSRHTRAADILCSYPHSSSSSRCCCSRCTQEPHRRACRKSSTPRCRQALVMKFNGKMAAETCRKQLP